MAHPRPPGTRRSSNQRSTLKRRSRPGDPMAAYDRLPPELRLWLAGAVLPWSARSVLRLWHRALSDCGEDRERALGHLSRIEAARLRRDTVALWGAAHPGAASPAR